MKNYLHPDREYVDIPVSDKMLDMLVQMQRLRWSQRADMLAVGQAVSQLLRDMAASGLAPKDFVIKERERLGLD